MTPGNHRPALDRLLVIAVCLAGLAAALTFPIAAIQRLAYPFELEWLESEMLQHTHRVAHGLPLYAPPAAEFSPTIYPPLFAVTAAGVAKLVGVSMLAPRLVSVLSILLAALIAGHLARTLSGSVGGGLVAVGLIFASYVPCGTFYDLGRVDALWVLLVLAGSTVAASARKWPVAAAAGMLLAAATLTKQPGGLFALVAAVPLAIRCRRLAIALLAAWGATSIAGYGLLHQLTAGWSTIYTVLIPGMIAHPPGKLVLFVRDDLLRNFAPLLILFALWGLSRKDARPGGPLPLAWWTSLGAAAFASLAMRTIQGGGPNTLMTLVVFGALMSGAIIGRVLHHGDAAARRAVLVVALVQFLSLVYNPLAQVPTRDERLRAEAFTARLAAIDGDVWVPSHTSFAYLAGKPFLVHRDPLLDLLYSGYPAFPEDLEHRLASGGFAAVVTDGPFAETRIQQALDAGYRLTEELADSPELRVGYRTRPRYLYLPR